MQTVEVAGVTGYASCRVFDTEDQARQAWLKLQRLGKEKHGKLDLGIYRHGPSNERPRYVTMVSVKRQGVELGERIIGGSEHLLDDTNLKAMLFRRAEVVTGLRAQDAPAGSYAMRHGRGAILHPDGAMEERIGRDE